MKIFVGCSASGEIDEKYINDSEVLLKKIFVDDHSLVFGASHRGILGAAYRIAQENGRSVVGLSPEVYVRDFDDLECDAEIVTKNIGHRTDLLIDNSDFILFLPGGIGTVYEILATIECKRSGEFDKPIIIYNSLGFFDDLIKMLNKIYAEKFAPEATKNNYIVTDNVEDVLNYIKEYSIK